MDVHITRMCWNCIRYRLGRQICRMQLTETLQPMTGDADILRTL
ncbi:hypothetical protein DsansV1_C38g0235341 [Dioscorea sansibarensis]